MENLIRITDANHLNKVFENAGDKLVVIMFYTKTNPGCRRIQPAFERSAQNHMISYFCIVDVDKVEGDSRYMKNTNNLPKLDFYYQGNLLGSYPCSDEKEIEDYVRSAERNVMMQNNMKNNPNNQNNNMNGMMGMNTQINTQMNPAQIRNQIINTAMMQNPMYAAQLQQNPMMLEQLVQRQMQMQQQQMMQPMQQPQMNVPQMNMSTMTQIPQIPAANTPLPNMPILPSGTPNVLPTLEQMQYYLKIFQMMQQMGVLNTNTINNLTMPEPAKPAEPDNIIVLPNGDKLMPLPNGKYGLIKNPKN